MSAHLREAWGKRIEAATRPRFPARTSAEDALRHMHDVHGMPVDPYKHRHIKADVVHQWHTDAHTHGHPGATNHDHSGKLRQTRWAQHPDDPERTVDGTGYYSAPPQGDDSAMERFLERHDR